MARKTCKLLFLLLKKFFNDTHLSTHMAFENTHTPRIIGFWTKLIMKNSSNVMMSTDVMTNVELAPAVKSEPLVGKNG